jgi:uncharacterized membrane protein
MPFCTQCGREVAGFAAFCGNCGARQTAASAGPAPGYVPPGSVPQGPPPDPLAGLSPRAAATICYIPNPFGGIASIIVLASRKFRGEPNVRFHAFQGLYLFAAWLIVVWAGPFLGGTGHFIHSDHILELLLLFVSIFMMIKASHDETYVLPIIGELAKRSATE